MNTHVVKIKLNEPFTAFQFQSAAPLGFMGAKFEAFDSDKGYAFVIYLPNPSKEDIDMFSDLRINTRVVRKNNVSFPLFRFGNSDLLFDVLMNPFLYQTDKGFQMTDRNNHVTFILVDSVTNLVRSMRYATMPFKLIKLWSESWTAMPDKDTFTAAYTKGREELYKQDLYDCWKEGIQTDYFGIVEETDMPV